MPKTKIKEIMKRYLILIITFLLSFTVNAQIPNYVPSNGLISWFPFNGNANDASINGNNGTVNGATLTTDRFGNANSAYYFNNNYIQIPSNSTLNNPQGSVSFWMNSTSTNLMIPIKKNIYIGANNEQYSFALNYTHLFSLKYNSLCQPGNGWSSFGGNNNLLINGNWHMVTATFSSSVKIYIDGLLISSNVAPNPNADNCPGDIQIGREWSSLPNYFNGKLDDIAIYNRVLSQAEVSQLYTAAPTYVWSTGETTATINPTPTATTTYWCDVTVNGVTCRKTMTITVNPNITPVFTQVAPICNGATLAALPTTSTNNITGTWSPALNNTATTTYTFTPTAGQCATTTTMTVTVNPLPLPPTGTITQTFCANIYPTLQNIVVNPTNVNWFSSLTSSTPLPITTNLPVGSTTYYASQFDAVTGCSSNGRLAVLATVLLENTPSTLTDQTFCSTDLKTLADIKTNGLNIVWYSSASGGTPLLGSYVLTSSQSLYAAIYNATTGCESPIRQMVQITIINCQLVANNLLTLNDNSLNDNLKIENIENFPINQIEIYNRFGEIVWKTEYYNNDTNTFKGRANVSGVYQKDSDLPTGTYYFLLKYYDSYRGKYTDLKSFLYINNNN